MKSRDNSYMDKSIDSKTSVTYPFNDTSLDVEERVQDLISRLSVEEKINFLHELSPALPRLGIKKYFHGNECLHGVVRPGRFTVFPQAIGLAATWDTDLIFNVATAISDEARAKHHNIAEPSGTHNGLLTFWSPTVNLARDPRWGRTPETYGEDPHLTQRIGVNFVKGLQGNDPHYLKTVSTPKHYVGNNQEYHRHKLKPNIPETWLRDYFLKGFKACIKEAKAQSIMGAYNAVFNIPCNQSKFIMTELLRNEWGFKGYTVTDCGAVRNALPERHKVAKTPAEAAAMTINAGVDMECGEVYRKGAMFDAYKQGLVTKNTINRSLSNILRGRMKLGIFDPDEMNPYSKIPLEIVGCEKHSALALKTAEKSIVLLKNAPVEKTQEKLLPINTDKVKSIAIVGPNSGDAIFGDYSGIPVNHPISPIEGLQKKYKDSKIELNYVPWTTHKVIQEYSVIPSRNLRPTEICNKNFGLIRKYYSEPGFKGKEARFFDEKIDFNYQFNNANPAVSNAQTEDNSIDEQMLKNGGGNNSNGFSLKWKGYIKPDITAKYKIRLWMKGIEKSEKPVFSINNSEFKSSHTMHLEKDKRYAVEIQMPKGKLGSIIRFEWKISQFPTLKRNSKFKREIKAAKNSDLVLAFVGLVLNDEHEGKDRKNFQLAKEQNELIKTLFEYNQNIVVILIAGSNLAINWIAKNVPSILHAWYPGERGGDAIANVLSGDYNPAGRLPLTFYTGVDQLPPFSNYDLSKGQTYWFLRTNPIYPFGHGLSYTNFTYSNLKLDKKKFGVEDSINLSVDVNNTGGILGEEVVQLYVSYQEKTPEIPIKQLKAFKRIEIDVGKTVSISLSFKVDDLAFWNLNEKKFEVKKGKIELQIGSSSKNIHLSEEIEIK